jgi:glutamate racemase
MNDSRPIGVFDSGLGGLTVCKEIFRLMPGERIIYLGDAARCPYGNRSAEIIRQFGGQDARFLLAMDIKMLVVACNTVSSVAIDEVQKAAGDVPVVGVVVPGAKAAVSRTAEKKIGVIGTRATVRSESYTRAIRSLDPAVKVYSEACPLFVPLAEEGLTDHDITRSTAQRYLYPLMDIGIDCLILGCTHYPLLYEIIQETVGTRIQLIDSAYWTAREAQEILIALSGQSPDRKAGFENSRFFMTDISPTFAQTAAAFLGSTLPSVDKVPVENLGTGWPEAAPATPSQRSG